MMHWIHWIWGGLSDLFSTPFCEKLLVSNITDVIAEDSNITQVIALKSVITKEMDLEGDLCW